MSAIAALKAARAAGLQLRVEGSDLVLEASAPPPSTLLSLPLWRCCNVAAMAGRPRTGRHSERAGIAEFDGGLSRSQAEQCAFACCVVEWLNRNTVSSMPGRFLGCGGMIIVMTRCCPTASNRPAMHGCMRAAGQLGIRTGRLKPSLCWRRWALVPSVGS
jgi:hypothetical protein